MGISLDTKWVLKEYESDFFNRGPLHFFPLGQVWLQIFELLKAPIMRWGWVPTF